MKQNLTLAAIFILLFSACEKEDQADPVSDEIFPVSFIVTNVNQTVVDYPPFTKAAPKTEDEFINHLWFFVYTSDGNLSWYTYQDQWIVMENDAFGDVHLDLPKGDFKLVVFGAKNHLSFPDSLSYSTAYLRHHRPWEAGDIFYKELPFTVTGEEIVGPVKIERISSLVEFNMMETATDLELSYDLLCRTVIRFPFDKNGTYEYDWFMLPLVEGQFESWKQRNIVFRSIILPPRGDSFDLLAYLNTYGPRAHTDEFKLEGIYVYPNKKTIVTGSLLNNKAYQNFYVDVDSTYADTTYIHTDDITRVY